MRFSANLGFLFTEVGLPEAVRAAARAGFDAVECHFPYATPPGDVRAALDGTGLPMLSLNTRPGAPGEFGLAALPGREQEARAAIAEAVDYAQAIGARAVHVMAGITDAPGAEATFRANLAHACDLAEAAGLTVLIEPLNPVDVPGYHLSRMDAAAATLAALDRAALRLMFDCYHVARTEGDPLPVFARHRAQIGHVQIAGVPDRGRPDRGTLDYARLLPATGWQGPVGAEYRPDGATGESLGWLAPFRALTSPRGKARRESPRSV
jgi:hydroxypyruvate isomerase